MVAQELVNYIKDSLQKGISPEIITSNLLQSGWKEEDIVEALNQIANQGGINPPSLTTAPSDSFVYKAQGESSSSASSDNVYPTISIERIQNPSRMYAIPILGMFLKVIMVVPLVFVMLGYGLGMFFIGLVNPFYVLFTGKYWQTAYNFILVFLRFNAKLNFFIYGLTNKYPGFGLKDSTEFTVDISYPATPKRLFAFPIVGGSIRLLLLIPYLIYQTVINYAVYIGAYLIAWFPVLFYGKYPDSIFEIVRDLTRLELATIAYLGGLSDTYPSFHISMNYKPKKLLLIGLASTCLILIIALNIVSTYLFQSSQGRKLRYQFIAERTYSNLAKPAPNTNELSQKAGFQVLIPQRLPKDYSYMDSYIQAPRPLRPEQKLVSIILLGKDLSRIDISEENKSYEGTLSDRVTNLAGTSIPQEISIKTYKGLLIENPTFNSLTLKIKTIVWEDDIRRFTITLNSPSKLSNSEFINFAESFYNDTVQNPANSSNKDTLLETSTIETTIEQFPSPTPTPI